MTMMKSFNRLNVTGTLTSNFRQTIKSLNISFNQKLNNFEIFIFEGWCVIKRGDEEDEEDYQEGGKEDQVQEFGFCRGPGVVRQSLKDLQGKFVNKK